jgi:hypothetical protein
MQETKVLIVKAVNPVSGREHIRLLQTEAGSSLTGSHPALDSDRFGRP